MGRTSDLRRVVLYTVAVIMASFGVTSMASAQSVITNTGPDSFNSITSDTDNTCTVDNTNNISVLNQTTQNASSGNAFATNSQSSLPWTGWASLDPIAAQTAGTSYNAWRNEITNWIAARASGADWNSANNSLTWTPSNNDWSSFDPMLWQASGQAFSNWLNAAEAYLNNNSTTWILGWPASATSNAVGSSASSGAAANNNNANFSISISNEAVPTASNKCIPTSTTGGGGMGGGPSSSTTGGIIAGTAQNMAHGTSTIPSSVGGNGGIGQGGPQSSAYTSYPTTIAAGSRTTSNQNQGNPNTGTPSAPGGGSIPSSSGSQVTSAGASISDTGPCSTNIVSSNTTQTATVTNVNTVSVTNTTTQTATSGSSTVANNGYGGGTSGNASNNNGTGLNTDFSN